MKCRVIKTAAGQWKCSRCEYAFKTKSKCAPHKRCAIPGWGDRLAGLLAWVGITKRRVVAIRNVVYRQKKTACGCQPRQEIVNDIGAVVEEKVWWFARLFKRHPKPPPAIAVRNLIYHVCPLQSNDGWRFNIAALLKRASAFNGKRVIAIAVGDNLHSPEVVKAMFPKGFEFIEVPNDKRLREVASFRPLLEMIRTTNPRHATFYAHTKGNSTAADREGAIYWRNTMYAALLDDWRQCMSELQTHLFVGTHKMVWRKGSRPPYPTNLKVGQWMHAGTFFWFRHDVFNNQKWGEIPNDRYGAEAWPSIVCPDHRQAKSMFQPWPESEYPTPSPYRPELYPQKLASAEELADIQRGAKCEC